MSTTDSHLSALADRLDSRPFSPCQPAEGDTIEAGIRQELIDTITDHIRVAFDQALPGLVDTELFDEMIDELWRRNGVLTPRTSDTIRNWVLNEQWAQLIAQLDRARIAVERG